MEKVSRVLKIGSIFLGGFIVFVVAVEVIDNYQTRWRYQQEMAAVTTEINNNQTYNKEPIVTYESLEAELRAAAIGDRYTDSERALLLNRYMGEIMSYGSGDGFSIEVKTLSGYNIPEMLVTYTQSRNSNPIPGNNPANESNSRPSDISREEPDAETDDTENKDADGSVENSQAISEPEVESAAEQDSTEDGEGDSNSSGDAGSEEDNSEEDNSGQVSDENSSSESSSQSSVGDIYYVPEDIGLNTEFSSGIPPKTRYDVSGLIAVLESAVKDTEYGLCYLKAVDSSGNVQCWYISDNLSIRLDTLFSDTALSYDGETVSGFETESKEGLTVYSGALPYPSEGNAGLSKEDAADAYLAVADMFERNGTNGIACLSYGDSYMFYVSDTARTTGFLQTLENKTGNQILYRHIKFYAETQFMSTDFTTLFSSLKESFDRV